MKQNNSKERNGFVFYASFLDAISLIPAKEQPAIYSAIALYALKNTEPDLKKFSKSALIAWTLIKPILDNDLKRFENGCKGAEHGKKGGAPAGNENARGKQPHRVEENNPIGLNETTPMNEKEKEIEKENEKEEECVNSAHTHTHTRTQEEIEIERQFDLFPKWCQEHAPLALAFEEPLRLDQFAWLYKQYGAKRMMQCAADLHDKEAYKSHRNAMNCWKKWIPRVNLAN